MPSAGISSFCEDQGKKRHSDQTLSPVPVYICSVMVADGMPVKCFHHAGCEIVTGYTAGELEENPRLWPGMVVKEDRRKVNRLDCLILGGRSRRPLKHRIVRKDGSMRWVINTPVLHHDASGQLISYDRVITDITDLQEAETEKAHLEMQLEQARKMEALGMLTGGIAHDFNNLLTSIMGFTELALGNLSGQSGTRTMLEDALKMGCKARDLVKQVLRMAKTEGSHPPVSIRASIEESLRILQAELPSTIELLQDVTDDGLIAMDPIQLHRIFMNLYANAVQSMEEKGGILEVSLKRTGPDHSKTLLRPYLKLTVRDTGHGMTPDLIDRIFDPFFTTKEPGSGTGLGLAVVRGIVKSCRGFITCDSVSGEGSVFEVYLPVD